MSNLRYNTLSQNIWWRGWKRVEIREREREEAQRKRESGGTEKEKCFVHSLDFVSVPIHYYWQQMKNSWNYGRKMNLWVTEMSSWWKKRKKQDKRKNVFYYLRLFPCRLASNIETFFSLNNVASWNIKTGTYYFSSCTLAAHWLMMTISTC